MCKGRLRMSSRRRGVPREELAALSTQRCIVYQAKRHWHLNAKLVYSAADGWLVSMAMMRANPGRKFGGGVW